MATSGQKKILLKHINMRSSFEDLVETDLMVKTDFSLPFYLGDKTFLSRKPKRFLLMSSIHTWQNVLEICPRGNNKSIIIIFPVSYTHLRAHET